MTVVALDRGDIRGKLYSSGKIPAFGFQRTADSIATDGIVDSAAFSDGAAGEGDFAAAYQYRNLQTDANRIKRGSVVDSTKWTHEGPVYTELTDLVYEAVGYLHPDVINDCIRLALRHCWLQYYWPLGWHVDNDFASSLTTSPHDWTSGAVNMTTIAKSTTGGVFTQAGQTGPRNLVLTGNGTGNGYVISSRKPVEPDDQIWHGAICRVNTAGATGSYVLYDVTNGAALETITFTSRAFQRIGKQTTIPTGCFQVEVRIGNVTASAATEWDCLFGHLVNEERTLVLPSWLTKRYQFLHFGPAEYGRNTDSYLWNATSRQIHAWYPRQDYQPIPLEADANLTSLQINNAGLQGTDYWLLGKRPYSDFEALDNETDTITIDEDYLMEAVYLEIAQALYQEYGEDRWQRLYDWAAGRVALQQVVRQPLQPEPVRQFIRYSA